tara:strand:+ start:351 stop:515 length:165 start_codon:yes stop_codon:yes gene_type:complete
MGDGSAFMIKLFGIFFASFGFMLASVLMTGIAGTWELFPLWLSSGRSPDGCRLS